MEPSKKDIRQALHLLGLDEHATDEAIRHAYLDLISVWHPDKHSHSERVRARATEETKAINAAYELLGTWDWREILDPQPKLAMEPAPMLAATPARAKFAILSWGPAALMGIALAGLGYKYSADKAMLEGQKRDLVAAIESVRAEAQKTELDLSAKVARADGENAELRRKLQEAIDHPRTVVVEREVPREPEPQSDSTPQVVPASDEGEPSSSSVDDGDVVRRGDSMAKVRRVFGKPVSVDTFGDTREVWWYQGVNRVTFENGAVSEWSGMDIEP